MHPHHHPHPHDLPAPDGPGGPRRQAPHDGPRHDGPHRGGPHRRGPGGPGPRGRRHGRGRAQRGDVRAAVLLLLAEEPMHGYQLMQAIGERTGGVWRPSPGAIYPTLSQLEDEGLVEVVREGGRKQATITALGRSWVTEHAEQVGDPFAAATDEGTARPDLRGALEDVHAATRQIAKRGTDTQVTAAAAALATARRALYLLLAEGPEDTGTVDASTPASTDDPDPEA